MSKYDKIKDLSENEFKRLTGVKKQTFNRKLALPKKLNADTPHPLNYHRAHRVHRGGFL